MAITIRIVVMDPGPLDGATPLPSPIDQFSNQDAALGLTKITLPAGLRFGRFDPGQLLAGQSGSFIIKHLSVSSAGGPHVAGSAVRIRPPALPDGTFGPDRTVLDFGDVGLGDGVIPEGLFPPVPVSHELVLDTQPDGAAPGPHVIQLTMEPARIETELTQRQVGVSGGDGDGDGDGDVFVYRPGGVPDGNVYTSFAVLAAALAVVQGPKIVEIDDSVTTPAVIPAGAFDVKGAVFRGRPGVALSILRGSVGTLLRNMYRIEGNLRLENNDPAASMVTLAAGEVFDVADGAALASLVAAPAVDTTAIGAATVRLQSGELFANALGPAVGASGGAGNSLVLLVYEGSIIGTDTIKSAVGSTVTAQMRDLGATLSRSHAANLGALVVTTIPAGASVEPDADNLLENGVAGRRWKATRSRISMALSRSGPGTVDVLYGANSVGLLQGSAYAIAAGTARMQIANPASEADSALGVRARVRSSVAAGVAEAYVSGAGAKASGVVEAFTADNAKLRATGVGSDVSGYVGASGFDATMEATGIGSRVTGYAKSYPAYGTVRQRATGKGARAGGAGMYFSDIYASGDGSVAEGLAFGLGLREASILASGLGSRATGMSAGGKIEASGPGSTAMGYAKRGDVSYDATVEASGRGSLAVGVANRDPGTLGPARLAATNAGSFALGIAYDANSKVESQGQGTFAMGLAITYGGGGAAEIIVGPAGQANGTFGGGLAGANAGFTARISSEENGSIAFGKCAAVVSDAYIQASAEGTFAHGRAMNGAIRATGFGSFANGNADVNDITSTGKGSFAAGDATAGAIAATADNATQFGPGANGRADTLQVGNAGIAFKGTVNAPGVYQNGDFWISGTGDVMVRTNGVTKNMSAI